MILDGIVEGFLFKKNGGYKVFFRCEAGTYKGCSKPINEGCIFVETSTKFQKSQIQIDFVKQNMEMTNMMS